MKKILSLIIVIFITFISTYLLITYNLKITDINNGNITVDILGQKQIYYFEK